MDEKALKLESIEPIAEFRIILLIDCSESMKNNGKMDFVKQIIQNQICQIRSTQNNSRINVSIRILQFSTGAQWMTDDFIPIEQFDWSDIQFEYGQVTDLGEAFHLLAEALKFQKDGGTMPERGIPPYLVLITDGYPTDDWETGLNAVMKEFWGSHSVRMAIGIEGADDEILKQFVGDVPDFEKKLIMIPENERKLNNVSESIKFCSKEIFPRSPNSPIDITKNQVTNSLSEDIPEFFPEEIHLQINQDIQVSDDVNLPSGSSEQTATAKKVYDSAQFTVYRPSIILPEKWYSLLFFAHLSERPDDAEEDDPDPLEEVERQAREILKDELEKYSQLKQDSARSLPSEGQLTIAVNIDGIICNPPEKIFYWYESVHREIFRIKTTIEYINKICRGRISVYFGSICVAVIPISIKVTENRAAKNPAPSRTSTHLYRNIFASYSHKDEKIVKEFEKFALTTGDKFLRDEISIRIGELWNEKIPELIRQADIFQLFWSNNSMYSPYVQQEWEYALSLNRPSFIMPVFWENPLPENKEKELPPQELRKFHFHKLPVGDGYLPIPNSGMQTTAKEVAVPDIFQTTNEVCINKNDNTSAEKNNLEINLSYSLENLADSLDMKKEKPLSTPVNPEYAQSLLYQKYSELHLIAKGGYGQVYRTINKDGMPVAVKLPCVFDTKEGMSFIAELRNGIFLNHRNIVRVMDFDIIPIPFVEMELCDGSLAEMKKPVDPNVAARIIFDACEGLKYAHSRSVIHCDLKPQNILMKDGVPKISDWGHSRMKNVHTPAQNPHITPYYAAPEQITSKQLDERTDIWQLGVILYELITGTMPFNGNTITDLFKNITSEKPISLKNSIIPGPKIESIISKCLEKDPALRYQSISELQDALSGISSRTANLIFISAKTEDFEYAEKLYTFLTEQGYNVFFCQHIHPVTGTSDYRKEIDRALDNAKHLIVVTSRQEYIDSPWLEAEWGFFIREKRSGRKKGNIITLIAGSMKISDLPGSLRNYEVMPFDPTTFDKLIEYLN